MKKKFKTSQVDANFALISYRNDEGDIPLFDQGSSGGLSNVTVIIGPNGSGKSRAISKIADELCYMRAIGKGLDLSVFRTRNMPSQAIITYKIGDDVCKIGRRGTEISCQKNAQLTNFSSMPYPNQVAAVAHLSVDKYRFERYGVTKFYKYLGLRQSGNLTTTSALETKVLQSLITGFGKPAFKNGFEQWLRLAGFHHSVKLVVELQTDVFLSANIDELNKAILNVQRGELKKSDARIKRIAKEAPGLHDFFGSIAPLFKGDLTISIDLGSFFKNSRNVAVWTKSFDVARSLRAFKNVAVVFTRSSQKHDKGYEFSELSSGEQQLIGTNARLLAELEPNSLVVIDEPELSLHPEWQMKYIPTLRASLENIPGTHVLIATHSHFMVSDLDPDSTALVIANKNSSSKFEMFKGDVYGRSPENILYRVFGVASTGNIYVENDLRNALSIISEGGSVDIPALEGILQRLQKVNGPDNVAMNIILERITAFIQETK
ncbi:AAA family ATPase [Pseudomonas viridiflava]|uniref:AAA family ATPase n=1 Tax=Pseudomonas viridiflava TaxID=33069 RepID=UPI001C2D1A63|nr:AAA family ATPase [Pseudomonas viridiflava]MBV1806775.1 ATP-binding protein [Pseudomonas viridiflava]